MEDIEFYLENTKEMMVKAISHVNMEFVKIRAGKAMPSMLESGRVSPRIRSNG